MKYKVLITPVEPSVDDHPNFTGVPADYEIDANSEADAEDIAPLTVSARRTASVFITGMITSFM
jgi:hypothetical protein